MKTENWDYTCRERVIAAKQNPAYVNANFVIDRSAGLLTAENVSGASGVAPAVRRALRGVKLLMRCSSPKYNLTTFVFSSSSRIVNKDGGPAPFPVKVT
jgi:hypothetical protein